MPDSPCISVCTDEDGICIGCLRTLDEIAEWPLMSEDRQQALLDELKTRQPPVPAARKHG